MKVHVNVPRNVQARQRILELRADPCILCIDALDRCHFTLSFDIETCHQGVKRLPPRERLHHDHAGVHMPIVPGRKQLRDDAFDVVDFPSDRHGVARREGFEDINLAPNPCDRPLHAVRFARAGCSRTGRHGLRFPDDDFDGDPIFGNAPDSRPWRHDIDIFESKRDTHEMVPHLPRDFHELDDPESPSTKLVISRYLANSKPLFKDAPHVR